MNKRYWVFNFICACSLVGLGWKLHKDWRQYAAQNGPQAVKVASLTSVPVPSSLPPDDYRAIALQNPFHPERNDVIAEPATAKAVGPPPLVYGSVILGETRFALLASEQSPKPQRVAEGGVFEGYRLVRVFPQSVVFESGATRNEVMLYNALERLHRPTSKTPPSAKASAPSPTPVVANAPAPPSDTAGARPTSADSDSSKVAKTPLAVPEGKEIMQTPFGPMVINKKP